jgi:hypothetical protein
MDLLITLADAQAALLQRRFGDVRAYVQGRVSDWVTQITPALEEAEQQDLLAALADAPQAVRAQVEALLAPYEPQPGPPAPEIDLEEG